MDNNEWDKILKEKLKDTIKPSKEIEDKIAKKIEEQKNVNFEKVNTYPKKNSYKRFTQILSFAAVFVLVFTFGIFYQKNTKNIDFQGNSSEVVKITAIKPTKLESGIVAKDTDFIITVDDEKSSVDAVRKSLYIEPALEYDITKTGNKEYKLDFKQNIPDNIILKLQYVKNKITEDSWSYQTNKNLSITKTFPAEGVEYVSKNTVIDICFSYANVENFEENVSISPKTEGKWQHLGKIWRFTPTTELKMNQKYVVIVGKDVKAEEKTLENEYRFSFKVGEDYATYFHRPLSQDGINTFSENEQITIQYSKNEEYSSIRKVLIRKFENDDAFIKYLSNDDYSNSSLIGQYEFLDRSNGEECFIQLKKNLPSGYYVASIQSENGTELLNAPIQINNIQSYAIETERDVVIWVAKDGKLAEGVEVNYLGKSAKTNKDGIVKIKSDGTVKMKYAKVGNEANKLVVGFNNFTHDNYPNAFVYTDRLLYKNNDSVNVWGFIPINLFYDEVDENEFYISLDETRKEKISIDKNGSFKYKFDLNNYKSDYSNIKLYYKDVQIGYRTITIENYELQNYEYEVISNKNYYYLGENIEFDVKVRHITGIMVPGKSVMIQYEGKFVKNVITNDKGIAHVSLKAENEYLDTTSGLTMQRINIFNGDLEEYSNEENSFELFFVNKDVYTEIKSPEKDNDTKYKVKLYKLLNNKNEEITEIEQLYDGMYDTEVGIYVEEDTHTRHITGYDYNEYTKQNEPVYEWTTTSNNQKISTIRTNNGELTFDKNSVSMKENKEEKWYTYRVVFEYRDRKGSLVRDNIYLEYSYEGQTKPGHWDESEYYNPRYCMYRYFFDFEEIEQEGRKFNIGDTIKLKLKESTNHGEKEIKNQGKVLRVIFKNDIKKLDIIENNNFDYVFSKDDELGVKITGAYLLNGKFYRMPTKYFGLDENSKKVDVEITSDKKEYKPGEQVTLNVKTTNKGKPIKTVVNINVVNEAVFLLGEGYQEKLLTCIYDSVHYPCYTYSSYIDMFENTEPGKGGGGGDGNIRSKFADTAFFDTIETNANGTAKVVFKLPDNVTTYRVITHAANKDLYLGENTEKIVSTLDFFIQCTQPRGIKSTDDVVLTSTSISDKDYEVDFEFKIEELDKSLKTSKTTNKMASVNFGKLAIGKYHAIIKGTCGEKTDIVKYEFEVVESRQEVKNRTTINISEQVSIVPSKNPIVLEIYNKQMKQYIDYIDFVEKTNSSRLDTRIAYREIQKLKNKYYGEEFAINDLDVNEYIGENGRYKNLKSGSEDLVLSALIKYFAGDNSYVELNKKDNLYEYYLYLASENESVLEDLKYLKNISDTDNYNKLLLTLSFEFLGDYEDARLVYNNLNLTESEKQEYASIIVLIDTFINKTEVINKLNKLIEEKPADEYLRFGILSFLNNNSNEIDKEETVTVLSKTINETFSINGLEIKTLKIYDSDLSEIKFETSSKDIMTSYYYQTSLENINSNNISKDIAIRFDGNINKNKEVTLIVDLSRVKDLEGEVQIALPNNLRLAKGYENKDSESYYKNYFLSSNKIDYLTYYKQKNCTEIRIPLMVSLEGNYKFENVVFTVGDGIYHISNSLEIK